MTEYFVDETYAQLDIANTAPKVTDKIKAGYEWTINQPIDLMENGYSFIKWVNDELTELQTGDKIVLDENTKLSAVYHKNIVWYVKFVESEDNTLISSYTIFNGEIAYPLDSNGNPVTTIIFPNIVRQLQNVSWKDENGNDVTILPTPSEVESDLMFYTYWTNKPTILQDISSDNIEIYKIDSTGGHQLTEDQFLTDILLLQLSSDNDYSYDLASAPTDNNYITLF